jgi:hypothetical protein
VPAMSRLVQRAKDVLACLKRSGAARSAHRALGATVTATSAHAGVPGEGPASALVDGDLATRWSSLYAEPQEVVVRLKDRIALGKIRLHWEAAAAGECSILASADGKVWKAIGAVTDMTPGPRIDEIDAGSTPARFIKLELLKRVNPQWGFSLYEIEVLDRIDAAVADPAK